MKAKTVKNFKQVIKRVLAVTLCLSMALPVMPAMAAPGGVIVSPILPPAFLFEPEAAVDSLKEKAQWNELEQLLDNPYTVAADPLTPGNDQGYPSYRSTIQRRRSFLPPGCTYDATAGLPLCNDALLPQLLVHPINYNPTTGEEMRILNPAFPGVNVEPGQVAIDYNSPINPPGGLFNPLGIVGGDPGEPPGGYSLPAVPAATVYPNGPTSTVIPPTARLVDPARGTIEPRDFATQVGGLKKPTIGRPAAGQPYPVLNTDPNNMSAANENDFVAGNTFAAKQAARQAAAVLGKALFWDMQLGSDSVQACGTCHFTAGIDTRTKNQLNPNHLGGDFTFQTHGPSANQEVKAGDFPLHKLFDPTKPGEPMLNPANVAGDTNDVMSSMGVVFGKFFDIPTPGSSLAFILNTDPPVLMPDLRSPNPLDNLDPIPAFQGLRRVEPRNTPTIFAAALNFDNFWDGRARHDFNGGSVFGAADPQTHVFVNNGTIGGPLTATRQIIRFSSIASLATGPALSNFEMSFDGRNWAKIGKKLLQPGAVPLANQLVDPTDSVLGPYSGQRSTVGGTVDRPGRPGLNVSYVQLIQQAYYPQLWANTTQHLNGAAAVCTSAVNGVLTPADCDPFDGYKLTLAAGPVNTADTSQFTQMEANMSLFFGLGLQLWAQILIPDNTPFDQFLDVNPDATLALGEAGEPLLVGDQLNCASPGVRNAPSPGNATGACFTPSGNFKRDIGPLFARTNSLGEGGAGSTVTPVTGTRSPGAPDPLLGFDIFHGTNLTLKNPNFRSARCGACHLGAFLTDNNIIRTPAADLGDFVGEFVTPGVEKIFEPLGRARHISGFLLESELNENGQDAIERFIINQSLVPDPATGLAFPDGAAFIDNGVYNLGVRPIAEDVGRGGTDAFGWPLSLSALMLKNLGGPDYEPGVPLPTFDPAVVDPASPYAGRGGGLFGPTAQDQTVNPGLDADPLNPLLPPHLAPWANQLNVGNSHPDMDEVFGGLNTLTQTPMLEGFIDVLGPNNPGGILNEATNAAVGDMMGTWPTVNRVGRMGSFKAPQLRNVELTGPYFHNGGMLTLRQVVDFYARGGDFPATNGGAVECDATHTDAHPFAPGKCYDVASSHRDMMILNLREEIQSLGRLDPVGSGDPAVAPYPDGFTQEEALTALVSYLLELTDERVAHEQAPFDRPEMFVPVDGTAPENTFGRAGFLAQSGTGGKFMQVLAVGAAGHPERLQGFLGVANTPGPGLDHFDSFTQPAGNVTLNGTVSIADALRILKIAVGLIQPTPTDLLLGDIAPLGAPDGVITIADALMILRITVGLLVI